MLLMIKQLPTSSGIYLIRYPNGKHYVGQASNLQKRLYGHWVSHRLKEPSSLCDRALKKYGFENCSLQVLAECCEESLNLLEGFFIEGYRSLADSKGGYNLLYGGVYSRHHSETTKQKLREARLAEVARDPEGTKQRAAKRIGIPLAEDHRQAISNGISIHLASLSSEQLRARMAAAQKANTREAHQQAVATRRLGDNYAHTKNPSQETRERRSKALRGKVRSEEAKQRYREAAQKRVALLTPEERSRRARKGWATRQARDSSSLTDKGD
jgi:group I intron endonuclease